MNDGKLPVILRLEVDQMRYGICTALTQHAAGINDYIQEAVNNQCTAENLQKELDHYIQQTVVREIKSSIDRYFSIGPGRQVINEAVWEKIPAALKDD
jgi:hypothetical protein